MKRKYKLKCRNADDVETFCNEITSFESDITLTIDNTTYDAKSLIIINALASGREVEIELLGGQEEMKKFNKFMNEMGINK